jgi:hypothetical protein
MDEASGGIVVDWASLRCYVVPRRELCFYVCVYPYGGEVDIVCFSRAEHSYSVFVKFVGSFSPLWGVPGLQEAIDTGLRICFMGHRRIYYYVGYFGPCRA